MSPSDAEPPAAQSSEGRRARAARLAATRGSDPGLSGPVQPQFSQPVRQIVLMLVAVALVVAGAWFAYGRILRIFSSNEALNGLILAVFVMGVLGCVSGSPIGGLAAKNVKPVPLTPMEQAQKDYASVTITYQIGDASEVLDSDRILSWLRENEDGSVAFDEQQAKAFVKSLAGWNDTAYYPSLADMQSSLTIYNSSSSLFTLKVMSIVSLLIPFVAAYIWYAWRAMNRKPITREEIRGDDHQY